jgi:peroxiredoxin
MSSAKVREMRHAGQRAPEFKLTRLDDGTAALPELLPAGPVLLVFFKTSCPVCQMTLPYLERLNNGGPPGSLRVYGISQDDAETTREFDDEFKISFPMLLDTEESGYPASDAYGISHVPSMFLVERDGAIGWSLEGFHKQELEAVGARAGVTLFRPSDNVPEWKAG